MELGLLNKLAILRLNNVYLNNRISHLVNIAWVSVMLLAFAYYATHNWFRVKKVIIDGDMTYITTAQLKYIANNKLHGTFFTLDIEELKEQFEVLPWVKSVDIQRKFPNTILVHVNEFKAVAKIADSNNLLADDGEVFDGADDANDLELPILHVDVSRATFAYDKYLTIESVVSRHGDHITNIWMSDPRILVLTTENNLHITLCEQDLTSKLHNLDSYWQQLYAINPNITTMNLCYKNAVAINATQ